MIYDNRYRAKRGMGTVSVADYGNVILGLQQQYAQAANSGDINAAQNILTKINQARQDIGVSIPIEQTGTIASISQIQEAKSKGIPLLDILQRDLALSSMSLGVDGKALTKEEGAYSFEDLVRAGQTSFKADTPSSEIQDFLNKNPTQNPLYQNVVTIQRASNQIQSATPSTITQVSTTPQARTPLARNITVNSQSPTPATSPTVTTQMLDSGSLWDTIKNALSSLNPVNYVDTVGSNVPEKEWIKGLPNWATIGILLAGVGVWVLRSQGGGDITPSGRFRRVRS